MAQDSRRQRAGVRRGRHPRRHSERQADDRERGAGAVRERHHADHQQPDLGRRQPERSSRAIRPASASTATRFCATPAMTRRRSRNCARRARWPDAIARFPGRSAARKRCAAEPGSILRRQEWVPALRSSAQSAAPRPGHDAYRLSHAQTIPSTITPDMTATAIAQLLTRTALTASRAASFRAISRLRSFS